MANNPIDKNKSYTNKDFNSIYNELLDIIPTLTNKWSPTNEGDPGVVLVKLMAILGDKLNFNIDKSALECFPASVTQRKNARQIYNLIGYKMKWYQSATATIGIKLKAAISEEITIPAFTAITNSENTITYTTLSRVILYPGDYTTTYYVDVIEGNVNRIVGDVNQTGDAQYDIDLTNLDANYCYYLTDINVAENGIFVSDGGSDVYDWEQVDNVNAYPLGSKVYEFNVSDDETSCYLKFPEDVSDLTGGSKSIRIKYVTSLGADGNVLANTLTTFVNSITDSSGNVVDSSIAISQPTAITSGANPESIDDAYTSARRTVSTFDTLITKLDYYNYIRELEYQNSPIVSNLVVTDREDDINNARDIWVMENGTEVKKHDNGRMTPYDLCLYMLDYDGIYDGGYNAISDPGRLIEIDNYLDDAKAISLNLIMPSSVNTSTTYLFKAKFKVVGEIITSEKLTQDEARELQDNIIEGLKSLYNSTTLDFGEKIDYAQLVENVQSMDGRIKAVMLREPTYTIYRVESTSSNGMAETLFSGSTDTAVIDEQNRLIAEMVARGNIEYYTFDDSLKYEFGKVGEVASPVKYIRTRFNLILNSSETETTLNPGEIVTLYAPQYVIDTEYSVGCTVTASFTSTSGTVEALQANENYIVGQSFNVDGATATLNSVTIEWTDTEGLRQIATLPTNTIFRCSTKLNSDKPTLLTVNNTLNVYTRQESTIDRNTTILQIALDDEELTLAQGQSHVFGVNEYIMYSDALTTEIVRLGNGIMITNPNSTPITLVRGDSSDSTWNSTNGLLAMPLTATNMNIVTANSGCKVKLVDSDGVSSLNLTNGQTATLVDTQSIEITDANGTTAFDKTIGGDYYTVMTRFDLTYTGDTLVRVDDAVGSYQRQEIILTLNDGTEIGTSTTNQYDRFDFSNSLLLVGGPNQDVSGITVQMFNAEDSTLTNVTYSEGIYTFSAGGSLTLPFAFGGTDAYPGVEKFILPITISELTGTNTVSITVGNTTIQNGTSNTFSNGNYIVEIENNTTVSGQALVISATGTCNIVVGEMSAVTGINTEGLGVDETRAEDIKEIIDGWTYYGTTTTEQFNYAHRVGLADSCDAPLEPDNMFDDNNICSKYTIAMYDYPVADENGNITYDLKVNKYSIKE